MALADGRRVPHSLAADPPVAQMLRAFGAHVQSVAMGTGFIDTPDLLVHRTPSERRLLVRTTGLSALPAPVMVGLAYTAGTASDQSVVAAAVYSSGRAARHAAPILARLAARGGSAEFAQPYARLWWVDHTRVRGRMVVMQLTTRLPSSVSRSVQGADFPPFWR